MLKSEILRRVQSSNITLPCKTPLRWLVGHLIEKLEREGTSAEFAFSDALQKKMVEVEITDEVEDIFKQSFEEVKTFLPKNHRIAEVEDDWTVWIPYLYKILQTFDGHTSAWNDELEKVESVEERKELAKKDFRGGRLVKPFSLFPLCANKVNVSRNIEHSLTSI